MQNMPPHLRTSGCFFFGILVTLGILLLGKVKAGVDVLDTFQNFSFPFPFCLPFPELPILGKPVFSLSEPHLFCSFLTPV